MAHSILEENRHYLAMNFLLTILVILLDRILEVWGPVRKLTVMLMQLLTAWGGPIPNYFRLLWAVLAILRLTPAFVTPSWIFY